MKTNTLFLLLLLLCVSSPLLAQQTWALKPYAVTLPRLTTDQQSTSAPQQAGNVVYNTDQKKMAVHNGTTWQYIAPAEAGQFQNELWIGFTQPWTVPPGVTRVLVELWSGGAGGSIYTNINGELAARGGGAGGYGRGIVAVIPGTSLSLIVGTGGRGAIRSINQNASSGGSSYVRDSIGTNYVPVFGASSSSGGRVPLGAVKIGFTWEGGAGSDLTFSYGQRSSTEYMLLVKCGNGGVAYGAAQSGFGAEFSALNSGSLANLAGDNQPGQFGSYPGGGGGAGYNYGGPGTDGMIVLHW